MTIAMQILQIVGSLGIFFFGMKVMSEAIQRLTGHRLRQSLSKMTGNRFKGILTGFTITSIIQSSSATTVLVVSLANAGLLTLVESIGVIMGANLGTTVTFWIISLFGFKVSVSAMAVPIVAFGIPLTFLKTNRLKSIGEVIVGFGILFLGIGLLKNAVPDIKNSPEILQFLSHYTDLGYVSILLFVLVGVLLTVIVQSSSAAGAITVTMAYQGWIDFPIAAAIVLGENIGTTITAYLASLGGNINARRAARAHFVFNVIGVIWMLAVFYGFIRLVDLLVPGDYSQAENIPLHLSAFHTLFNFTNIVLLVGFVPQIAKFVEKIVKQKTETPADEAAMYSMPYIASRIVNTPEMRLFEARKEIAKMAIISHNMFQSFLEIFFHPDESMRDKVGYVENKENLIDKMKDELTRYLARVFGENLADNTAFKVTALMRIVNEIESVGDCCQDLTRIAQKRYDKKIELHPTADDEIRSFSHQVTEFIQFNIENILDAETTDAELRTAIEYEMRIDESRENLRENSVNRIGESGKVEREMMFMEIIKNFERIGDYSLNIAEALKRV